MGVIGINLLHYPVFVLGPKIRIGLWLQGCSIRCKGCMSKHTWDFDQGKKMDIDVLSKTINSIKCENITISGGEPFDQSEELLKLLKSIRNFKKDILLYTGYSKQQIFSIFSNHLNYIDAIVCNPFKEGNESLYQYKGSNNQEMIILNDKMQNLYENYAKREKSKTLQKTKHHIIGIPYQKVINEL